MAMAVSRPRRPRPPLDPAKLEELALGYVGRFATSRAKLISYLKRKLRERGWDTDKEPDLEDLADRLVRLGYIDDEAFAMAKARSLTARGYGERRVGRVLAVAGIGEQDGAQARSLARGEAVQSALRFARRRSIGPFAPEEPDLQGRQRALAAMIRAGHDFGLSRAIVELPPGAEVDLDMFVHTH